MKTNDNWLWEAFEKWANENSISLDTYEDWGEWWRCFEAGATAEREQREKENMMEKYK